MDNLFFGKKQVILEKKSTKFSGKVLMAFVKKNIFYKEAAKVHFFVRSVIIIYFF